jgi:hypothetical protein
MQWGQIHVLFLSLSGSSNSTLVRATQNLDDYQHVFLSLDFSAILLLTRNVSGTPACLVSLLKYSRDDWWRTKTERLQVMWFLALWVALYNLLLAPFKWTVL